MSKKRLENADRTPFLRLEPDRRICPVYEDDAFEEHGSPKREEMGFCDLDDFCEEHIQ